MKSHPAISSTTSSRGTGLVNIVQLSVVFCFISIVRRSIESNSPIKYNVASRRLVFEEVKVTLRMITGKEKDSRCYLAFLAGRKVRSLQTDESTLSHGVGDTKKTSLRIRMYFVIFRRRLIDSARLPTHEFMYEITIASLHLYFDSHPPV